MTDDVAGVFATPYVHDDPAKFDFLLSKCCEHRPWFDDYTWNDQVLRRVAAIQYLADAWTKGRLWEVYSGANLVGLLILNEVRHRTDAKCHFIFFDHKLANKRVLCLNAMRWAFDHLDVHRLSVEVPEYAHALVEFACRKLGFRHEAERQTVKWPKEIRLAILETPSMVAKFERFFQRLLQTASRKHQAMLYKGQWQDVLLLSITREEFDAHVRSVDHTRGPEAEAV